MDRATGARGGGAMCSVDSHVMSRRAAARPLHHVALVAAAFLVLLTPVTALGHAALDSSTPADGETVTGTPSTIDAAYTETLDPGGSSLVLVDASGTEIATGGVTTTTEPTKEMSITGLPDLAPGTYTVRSTTKSTADGDVDRTTWSFTVVAAPSPTSSPTPGSSLIPAASPSAAASAPAVASAPAATPAASPSGGDDQAAGGTSDVLLPIVAGLAIVVVAAVWLASRRGRTSPPA